VEREAMTLPPGWVWTTIGEITKPIEKVDPAAEPNKPFTYLDISSIDNTTHVIREPKGYYGADAPSRARQRVHADDVLFSTVRTYLKNIAQVPEAYDGQIASTGFSVLRGKPGVSSKYLFYFTLTTDFLSALAELQRGTSYPAVRDGDVRAQPIPLAPLAEQRRIVAKIEELFTRLDAGVAALKRAQANVKRYKAAVLKAACEGRLVPQDPNDEPASKLLERILAERRKKWEADLRAKGQDPSKAKYVEPKPPDTDGLPELPSGWCWTRFDDLLIELKNGHFSKAPASEPPGIPILRISAVRPLSVSLESPRYLQEGWEKVAQYQLHNGDLLFTRYNGTLELVGVCGMVRGLGAVMIYPDKLIRARVFEGILPDYLEVYFATDIPRRIIENKAKSTAGQQGVAGADLKALPVAVPPLAEQRRIVAEVERRLSVVQKAEAVLAANLARAERLRQSILKQAFEGRLVPQDPNDEPANVLLEKIRAQAKISQRPSGRPRRKQP